MVERWLPVLAALIVISCGDSTDVQQPKQVSTKSVSPIKMEMLALVEPNFKTIRKRVLWEGMTEGVADLAKRVQLGAQKARSLSAIEAPVVAALYDSLISSAINIATLADAGELEKLQATVRTLPQKTCDRCHFLVRR